MPYNSENVNIVSGTFLQLLLAQINEEYIFPLFIKHVELGINIFCIYISSSSIKKRDACSSYLNKLLNK